MRTGNILFLISFLKASAYLGRDSHIGLYQDRALTRSRPRIDTDLGVKLGFYRVGQAIDLPSCQPMDK